MKRKIEVSPLFEAVLSGNTERVRDAINAGEHLEGRDRDGRTCLFQAVVDGNGEITSLLIENGANVAIQDNEGETPLHFAAREYQLRIAELLLRAGAVVDAQDLHGNTPLARAVFASRGRGEMIKLLIAHGADRANKNNYGVSPLSLAESIGNYDVLQFIHR